MKINLFLVHKKYRKDIMNAVNEFLIDFPILNNNTVLHMKSLDKSLKDSFASQRNRYTNEFLTQEIKLNPLSFLFSNIDAKFKTVADANYETVKDIIWHELGHCLQLYILCDYYKLDLSNYAENRNVFYNKLENHYDNNICYKRHMDRHILGFGWNYDNAKHFLGSYATNDPAEFIPECFNNYYRLKNKTNLDKYEQELFRFVGIVVNDYKRYVL